jgi:hypothetical protein
MIAQRNLLLPCLYLGDYLRVFEHAPGHYSMNLQGVSLMAAVRGHGRNALAFWKRLNSLEGWNHLFDEGPDNDRRYPRKPRRKKVKKDKARLVWSPAPAATPA